MKRRQTTKLTELLNVDRALKNILSNVRTLSAETVTLAGALNRVLAEDIRADINLPPFPNSSMDGYAVRASDIVNASRNAPMELRVTMDIPAGTTPDKPIAPGEAARIMTGAPLPDGADAVVPVEESDSDWSKNDSDTLPEKVAIYKSAKRSHNVRAVGENIKTGQTVLRAGMLIRPQEIGILAALGHSQIPVVRQPRAAILSTGNELVEVDQPLTPGKIHNSNSYTLAALVQAEGGIPLRLPTSDDTMEEVRSLFQNALEQKPDLIISSAGVSVGAADLVHTVLGELGKVGFWRINLRPGKPLAFGQLQGVPFFGLPGNPVSAMVTFDVLVRPALLKMSHRTDAAPITTTIVGEDIQSDGRRSYLRVTLTREDNQLIAHTTGTQSSGALMSMVLADGLLIVPEGVKHVSAGAELQVRLLRKVE